MPNGTAVVGKDSGLIRKKWVQEGLILKKSQSFMTPYTGMSMDNIVYQRNDLSKQDGHEVEFQFDGNLIAAAVEGKETAFGTGEPKHLYSSNIRVKRVRTTADLGDTFDAINISSRYLSEFTHTRNLLADKWTRMKDQALFDVGQLTASHRIVRDTLGFDDLARIQTAISTGIGLQTMDDATKKAAARRPLSPFKLQNGEPIWLLILDELAAAKFQLDKATQNIIKDADVRGNENRLLRGVIGRIGRILVVSSPLFFGRTLNTKKAGDFVTEQGYATFNRNEIEISGLRTFSVAQNDNKVVPKAWRGEGAAVAATDKIYSRGLLLGAGAFQFAMGKEPDFMVQASEDFGIKKEACMEFYCGCKATRLYPESGDDYPHPLSGMSYGIVAVDINVTDLAQGVL